MKILKLKDSKKIAYDLVHIHGDTMVIDSYLDLLQMEMDEKTKEACKGYINAIRYMASDIRNRCGKIKSDLL